jgi:phytoene dehydrogenase-like protein
MAELAIPTEKTKDRVKVEVPRTADVVIVGAGLGGLMSGANLALAGKTVVILDQHYVAGGCATMFHRTTRDGRYQFDVGLHYIGDCGEGGKIPTLLGELGIELEYIPMDDDGFDTVVLPDLTFPIPVGHDRYRDRLVEFFPGEKKGIDRYVRLLKEVDHMATFMDQRRSGGGGALGMLWQVATRARLLPKYQNATIKDVLDDCTKDMNLRAVLLGQSGDYGVAPDRASALLHMGLQNHYFKGAWYPKGGGQIIADRLCELIESRGGVVALRKPVEEILVEGGKAVGVRVEPPRAEPFEVRAPIVISNADLVHTLKDLLPTEVAESGKWKGRADRFEMGGAIMISCFGVQADLRELGMQARNYWCFDTNDADAIYRSVNQGSLDPRAVYITSASLKDPETHGHTPDGVMGVEVMALMPGKAQAWGVRKEDILSGAYRRSEIYLANKQKVEDALVAKLDQYFPGAAEKVVFRETASPVTHTRFTRATDGTGYGLAATPEQFMKGRPGYRGPVPGLYLAGANTRSGHGIVGSMASGKECAVRVQRDAGA